MIQDMVGRMISGKIRACFVPHFGTRISCADMVECFRRRLVVFLWNGSRCTSSPLAAADDEPLLPSRSLSVSANRGLDITEEWGTEYILHYMQGVPHLIGWDREAEQATLVLLFKGSGIPSYESLFLLALFRLPLLVIASSLKAVRLVIIDEMNFFLKSYMYYIATIFLRSNR